MQYRRFFVKQGCYFFTLVTESRRPIFADPNAVILLREAFKKVMLKRPFSIDAIVVLPDHIHCIWTLPEGDADFSTRWRLIKTYFTKHYPQTIPVTNKNRINRRQQVIWQHRYWEHVLRDEKDLNRHIEYIHYNPVKHGYAASVVDWQASSFHAYVRRGVVDESWGSEVLEFEGIGHE
ncbi:MAG: transposase [Methyloprofundus sp.]|nr:transposase [Methyloprofundus sp.]